MSSGSRIGGGWMVMTDFLRGRSKIVDGSLVVVSTELQLAFGNGFSVSPVCQGRGRGLQFGDVEF